MKPPVHQTELDWVPPAIAALHWFIAAMGTEEWHRRRQGVVDYFRSIDTDKAPPQKLYHPIAYYDDWMAWYMYLVESIEQRPAVDDPFQSARVYPFFAAIGRQMTELQAVPGIDDRLKEMLNQRKNQPDSTLFELAVAILYIRNGWLVRFLKERLSEKTPDFEVSRDGKTFWVECKRLAKVTDFANEERAEWVKRFRHLTSAMRLLKISAHADVTFKIPIADVPEELLGQLFIYYVNTGWMKSGKIFSVDSISFQATPLDIAAINTRLDEEGPRVNSPAMIEVIAGNYEMHGSYTQLIDYAKYSDVGPEDGLHVLNRFCQGIHAAYSAKYTCLAASSIEKKAKDVRKVLKKAVDQITGEQEGIIHIGYETVNGPEVELVRHQRTKDTVTGFDYRGTQIEAVYCHAIQPLVKIGEFECAETTLYFEKHPGQILDKNLLLDSPGSPSRNGTHWEEDLNN
ncbi:hypothetical protein [Arcticibacter tournemirensis]|uniref:Uncharacterized protein n=2 Tax=Pseudomonadati TaxID=3379134 RepID=A0A4Q0M502_9SPHI|nr:hypothetical protein [Arcticibacter tournemirensis]RXF67736.1 hypothetical protein EKH83_18075 [Arcticibacter tournemirensis]